VMMEAYFDESGIHDGAKVCVVAGFYGTQPAWRVFENQWKKILSDYPELDGEGFHAKRFFARNENQERVGRYIGWADEKVFRLSWKWRKRSSVKIAERTYEKRAQASGAGRRRPRSASADSFIGWASLQVSSKTGGSAMDEGMNTTVGCPEISGWRRGRKKPSSVFI
jgi:hypothetical protein